MAPSHGFAAACHRAKRRSAGPSSHGETAFRGAAGFREVRRHGSTHREMRLRRRAGPPAIGPRAAATVRPADTVPSPTAKSLSLAPAGTASNFAWSGKKTATLYRVTVPDEPVLVRGNRLGGAKGPQPVLLQCDAPPCGPPP